MNNWRQLLADFQYQGTPDAAAKLLPQLRNSGPLGGEQALGIHRSHLLNSLGQQLQQAYPLLAGLLGEQNFNYLTRRYTSEFPSTHLDLGAYGEHLHRLMDEMEPERRWLGDICRWEWQWHSLQCLSTEPDLTLTPTTDALIINPSLCIGKSQWNLMPLMEARMKADSGDPTALQELSEPNFEPFVYSIWADTENLNCESTHPRWLEFFTQIADQDTLSLKQLATSDLVAGEQSYFESAIMYLLQRLWAWPQPNEDTHE